MFRLQAYVLFIFGAMLSPQPAIQAQDFSPIINFPVEHFIFESATYVDANGDSIRFNLDVYYHIPANPIGIIYFFHGSGGSARLWFVKTRVEQPLLMREAVSRGFGVVSMESNNRNGKVWDNNAELDSTALQVQDNVDTEHVWRVHADSMLAKNRYSADLPLFAVGFSNGGAFTNMLALRASTFYLTHQDSMPDISHIIPFRAVAIYGAVGRFTKSMAYDLPTIFNLGINDNKAPAYPNMTNHPDWPYPPESSVEASHNLLMARGVASEFNVKPEETLQPYRFARIPGIDTTGSRMIYDALKAARGQNGQRLISEQDSLLFNPKRNSVRSVLPQQFKDFTPQIDEQLVAVYAEHLPLSDFKNNTLDFFEEHLTVTSVTQPAGGASPHTFVLEQNYPNPFNPTTTITYTLSESSIITLKIYNIRGALIRTLIDTYQNAGIHRVSWDGRDDSGKIVPSGQYYYDLQSGRIRTARKMILLQ